jgi:hypothetical protein
MTQTPLSPPRGTADDLIPIELDRRERERLAGAVVESVRISLFGTVIEVAFDDPIAASSYRARYARFSTLQDRIDMRAFAVEDGNAAYFWVDDRPAHCWTRERSSALIDFLTDAVVYTAYFNDICPYVSIHAAAIAVDDVAIALTAASEGGKSTTSIACGRRGMPLYSDEVCIFDGRNVHPYPRALNIRAAALDLLAGEPFVDALTPKLLAHRGSDWKCVAPDELFGTAALLKPQPLAAIFFIVGRGSEPAIAPMEWPEAIPRLLNAPMRSPGRGVGRIADAVAALSRGRPMALTLGTPDSTALAIRDAVRRMRVRAAAS